jgi:hypothetical protein
VLHNKKFRNQYCFHVGVPYHSSLGHNATRRKVAGGGGFRTRSLTFFNLPNPSSGTMALGLTQPLKVATHVTASLTSLHDQSFCTRTHKIPSPPYGTSTLEQAPVCTWNMSSSDDDVLALAAFVLMCKRKPRKKKRDVWCKTGYEKETLFPH